MFADIYSAAFYVNPSAAWLRRSSANKGGGGGWGCGGAASDLDNKRWANFRLEAHPTYTSIVCIFPLAEDERIFWNLVVYIQMTFTSFTENVLSLWILMPWMHLSFMFHTPTLLSPLRVVVRLNTADFCLSIKVPFLKWTLYKELGRSISHQTDSPGCFTANRGPWATTWDFQFSAGPGWRTAWLPYRLQKLVKLV